MKRIAFITALVFSCCNNLSAQQRFFSRELAETVMHIWKDSFALDGKPSKWTYDQGVILEGILAVWKQTGDPKWFNFIQKSMDFYVNDAGDIRTYKLEDYNIDNVKNGRSLLSLYRITGKEKYWKAATKLRDQLKGQPRTKEGGFWHKKIYPYQMWLDGLYMGEPFYTEYAMLAHDDSAFSDIANQFIWMETHARDPKTGLLYHGWDESKQMPWANQLTGNSPNFWARAMGWYGMALVDVLENFPKDHPGYPSLVSILKRTSDAVIKVQDKKTGLWYDLPDLPATKGNYFEASASSMFVYTLAKACRLGVLPKSYLGYAEKGYKGILSRFIEKQNGRTVLTGTVKVSGLGGKPYRDGSVAYYLGEPVIVNDPKGMGAFILAATEMEMVTTSKLGKGRTILLDYYFNHETTKDITGKEIQHHYIWEEMSNRGYSLLGNIFNRYGMNIQRLTGPVSEAALKNTAIYFIIDPDWPKENKKPNYIEDQHISSIVNWVKKGGVLMLFANDSNNVEFKNYNRLAEKFGIRFNEDHRNMVPGNDFATGTVDIPVNHPVFKTAKNVYLKEISTLSVNAPAKSLLSDKGDVIMAVSKYGKGTVFAVGDPWLYNEYLDGRKLPSSLENYKAAEDLVQWLIKQIK